MANPSMVSANSGSTSGAAAANITLQYAQNVVAGNTLVMLGHCAGSNPVSFTISDDQNAGNWAVADSSLGNNCPGIIAYKANTVGGVRPTVTFATGSSVVHFLAIGEIQNVTTTPLDQHNDGSGSGTTNITTGNITTTQAIELLYVGVGNSFTNTFSVGSGYTLDLTMSGGKGMTETQVVTTTGTYAGTASQTNNQTWAVYIASFFGTATPVTPYMPYALQPTLAQ